MNEPRGLVKLRTNISREMRKAIVIGNGAIAGGAECLAEVIRSLGGKDAEIHSGLQYAVALSFYSANIRTQKNMIIHDFVRSGGNTRNFKENLSLFTQKNAIRKTIAKAFFDVKKYRLAIRKEFDTHVPDVGADDVGVVTINWDECLWDRTGLNLVQLHGRASESESLILPMEQIGDAFILEALKIAGDSRIDMDPLKELFRNTWQSELVEAEKSAFNWISSASELVIYGVAVNPYDAELLQVLRQWNNMKPLGFKETRVNGKPNLTIVNPNPSHADLAARFLCVREYLWINPENNLRTILSLRSDKFVVETNL